MPKNVKTAFSANKLHIKFNEEKIVGEMEPAVRQLHNYIVDNSSMVDATRVVTQFFKLLDAKNLIQFLPKGLRKEARNPNVSVDITGKNPLTFNVEANFEVGGHTVKVKFCANVKEKTIQRGGFFTPSIVTGEFASGASTDPEQDSLHHIRYFIDNEEGEGFKVFG